jgi:transposase
LVDQPAAAERLALLAAGMSVREIAEEIGIAKSVVHRLKQKIERAAKEADAGGGG